ncbi:hypothetical protein GCM10028801_46030 [Nocardioides maradonensis]
MYTIFLGNRHFSGWSMRANIAIREKAVPFREVPIDMDWPDHIRDDGVLDVGDWTGDWCRAGCYCLTDDLTRQDPTGRVAGTIVDVMPRVPVLVHEQSGAVASDILAIVELLEETAPASGTALLGRDIRARAQIRSFSGNAYVDFQPIVETASYGLSLWDDTPSTMPREATDCAVLIERTVGRLLSNQSEREWLFGDFSLADIMMSTFMQELTGWNYTFTNDVVAAYATRLLARPSIAQHLHEARKPYEEILAHPVGTAPWIIGHYRYNPDLRLLHDWRRNIGYVVKNDSMRTIVEHARAGLDFDAIAQRMAADYAVDAATVRGDVDRIMRELDPRAAVAS